MNKQQKQGNYTRGLTAVVVALIIFVGLGLCTNIALGSGWYAGINNGVPNSIGIIADDGSEAEYPWYFYAYDVNNGNFGPNPADSGCSDDIQYWSDLVDRTDVDPTLGSAVMYDAYSKTGYDPGPLAEMLAACNGDYQLAINKMATHWVENPYEYVGPNGALTVWVKYMVNHATIGLYLGNHPAKDQMYMVTETTSGIPEVVVRVTDQTEGPWLVIRVEVKGNVASSDAPENGIAEIWLRCPCGYQPSDVAESMNITPEPAVTQQAATSTPQPSSTTPTQPPSGGGEEPVPPPVPPSTTPKKDESQSPVKDWMTGPLNQDTSSETGRSTMSTPGGTINFDNMDEVDERIERNQEAVNAAETHEQNGSNPTYEPGDSNTTLDNPGGTASQTEPTQESAEAIIPEVSQNPVSDGVVTD